MRPMQGGPTTLANMANFNTGIDAVDFCEQILDGNMEDMWLNLLSETTLASCVDALDEGGFVGESSSLNIYNGLDTFGMGFANVGSFSVGSVELQTLLAQKQFQYSLSSPYTAQPEQVFDDRKISQSPWISPRKEETRFVMRDAYIPPFLQPSINPKQTHVYTSSTYGIGSSPYVSQGYTEVQFITSQNID